MPAQYNEACWRRIAEAFRPTLLLCVANTLAVAASGELYHAALRRHPARRRPVLALRRRREKAVRRAARPAHLAPLGGVVRAPPRRVPGPAGAGLRPARGVLPVSWLAA